MKRSKVDRSEEPAGFDEAFELESHTLLVERLRLALTVGALLYAAFWVLDLVSAPEHAFRFLTIRLTVAALAGVTVAATYTALGRRFIELLSVSMLSVASLGISVITTYLGGFDNDYYIGNMLVLFFVGLFMPWSLALTATFCALLNIGYFGLNLALHGPALTMVSPTFFLIGTSAFTCCASVATDRSRRRDLTLRLRLERANDELKELDEAKTRFFANVSHELRTPLMLILGPLESLLRGDDSGDTQRLLETMNANAHRLLRQVNMILDFARVEAGRLRCEPQSGNLGEILRELVWGAGPYAEQRGITLTAEGLDATPQSDFDLDKMETVAANLLSNAMKFTPDGGCVTVRAGSSDERLWFEVSDTGVGIPADHHERIFDRFTQVPGEHEHKTQGTGLGLALTRELVDLHRGSISVESREGHGAKFRVEIPRATSEQTERRVEPRRREDRLAPKAKDTLVTQQQRKPKTGGQTHFADLEGRKLEPLAPSALPEHRDEDAAHLLLVEDNPDLRAFLSRSLSTRYWVETAENGLEGLAAARRRPPDLIVSDVMMPRMDGYELVRQLRADAALRSIPVILLTAKTGSDSAITGLGAGANDYVTKPFNLRELEARISAHLRARATEEVLDERETRLAAIGQMTSSVLHDLRGPLTAIVGHTELARLMATQSGSLDTLEQDLDAVKSAAARAEHMICDVVEFARGGDLHLELRSTPLGSFVESIGAQLAASLTSLSITLTVRSDPDEELHLPIDRERIQRVLENLVRNARDALSGPRGSAGEKRIWIEVRARRDGASIRVADNGLGVPLELSNNLFEAFATAGKKNGTGLGLAIVRNLIAAHGGTVSLEPEPPEGGAAFTLYLPREHHTDNALLAPSAVGV